MSKAEYWLAVCLWGLLVGELCWFSLYGGLWGPVASGEVAHASEPWAGRANWYQNELRNVLYAPSGDYLNGPMLAPSNDMTDTLSSILAVDQDVLGNVKAQATVVAAQATQVAGWQNVQATQVAGWQGAQATAAAQIRGTMQVLTTRADLVNQGVYSGTRLVWNIAVVGVVVAFLLIVGLVIQWLR